MYIQQHLANERTFLAWVRTAIAITGIGFLVMNLHVKAKDEWLPDYAVLMIGILSVLTGIIMIMFSTVSYCQKITHINKQTFRASKRLVLLLAALMITIIFIFGSYFITNNI